MTTTLLEKPELETSEQQFATFYVGDMLLGIDIRQVQEINREFEVTLVPHAPDYVRGVINLRGDVASVINLSTILGLPEVELAKESRNLIANYQNESVGFVVDRISDIVTLRSDQIAPQSSSINGVEGKYFSGVFAMETEILVILNIEEVLSGNCTD